MDYFTKIRALLRCGLLCGLLAAPNLAIAADINGVSLQSSASGELITLQTSREISQKKIFSLDAPPRIVIDFPSISAENIRLPVDYNGNLLTGIRFGQFDAETSRLVLDLARPATVKSGRALPPSSTNSGWAYVIELMGNGAAQAVVPLQNAQNSRQAPAPAAISQPVIAAQPKPLIAIDAGHGGQDPGAISASGGYEKNVTLRYAKALRKALLQSGRYRVILTRDTDIFIALGERVNIARRAKADLFISLHADSAPRPEARGMSIYTLSETASDAEAEALAAQENKADLIGGIDLDVQDKDVADILIDLAQRETMNKSSVLAEQALDDMHPKVLRLPQPHRFAGFRVLKAPDIPSVLVELGFLSNGDDERLLSTREYETIISNSLLKTIDNYMAKKPTAL